MLNVAAALALPAPIRDPFEPNDDIDQVDPNGDRYVSKEPALRRRRSARRASPGRIDRYEDPRDVFRVWLPAASRVTATLTASSDGDLALYSATARSVVGRFATDGRLAIAATKGTRERLVYTNKGKGRWAYVAVQPGAGALDATYSLAVASAATDAAARRPARRPRRRARPDAGGRRRASARGRATRVDREAEPRARRPARSRTPRAGGTRDRRTPRRPRRRPRGSRSRPRSGRSPPAASSAIVELDVDEEPLPVAPLLLEHAVEPEELDRPGARSSRARPYPAPRRRRPRAPRRAGARRGRGRASRRGRMRRPRPRPTPRRCRPAPRARPATRASVDLRESPTSTGRPIATIRSSRRTSSRFWSGVLPKPIPGSRQTRSSGSPAADGEGEALLEEGGDLGDDVLVVRRGLHRARLSLHVHQAEIRPRLGDDAGERPGRAAAQSRR